MKKKNLGFTLVEMLATILVLLVILLIATPSIRRMLNKTNELSKEYIENIVIDAAKEYTTINNKTVLDRLKQIEDTNVLTLDILYNTGLIDLDDIETLGTDARVLLTLREDNNVEYKIVYDGTLASNIGYQLILLGGDSIYVSHGTTYLDPGYIALDEKGKKIEEKVEIIGTVNPNVIGTYLITYKLRDASGNEEIKTREVIVYDSTYPTVTIATILSNNPYDTGYVKNGETVTLNISFSKVVTTPKVKIGGREAVVTGSGTSRVATLQIPSNESSLKNGELSIKVYEYKDIYNNQGEEQTNVTSGSLVVFDNIKPSIIRTIMLSNNPNNKVIKNNETITMETLFTEPVMNVSTKIGGRTPTLSGDKTNTITGSYLISDTESNLTEGELPGTIESYMDRAGNLGETTDIKLSGSLVLYDRTPPSCVVSGGNSSWTSGNITVTGTCSDTVGGSGCVGNISYTYSSSINTTTAGAAGDNVGGTVTDNAGNSSSCVANQTVKIDKTSPTCTTSKTNTGTTSGVTVTVTGTDSESGISSGNGTFTGVKSNTTYTVENGAGLTGTCSVEVSPEAQYRSRTCSAHCASSACSCKTWGNYTYNTTYGPTCTPSGSAGSTQTYVTCADGYQYRYRLAYQCIVAGTWATAYSPYHYASENNAKNACKTAAANGTGISCRNPFSYSCSAQSKITHKVTRTYTGSCTAYNTCPACGCNSWNSWSGWSTTSCTPQTNVRQCENRTLYY